MSTNYYLKPKIINKIKKDLENSVDAENEVDNLIIEDLFSKLDGDTYLLHIGKRSCGNKPTFYKNIYWSSVEEIIDFYDKNKEKVSIIDEYDTELSLDELKDNLINWNKDNKNAKTPFDRDNSGFSEDWLKHYYKDKEGYIFTDYDFS